MSQLPEISRIVRSRRKTVALVVTTEGELEVRAPLRFSRHQIDTLVREKSSWIEKQVERAHKASHLTAHRQLGDGARLWYLGKSFPLRLSASGAGKVHFVHEFTLPESALPKATSLLTNWYKAQAHALINERVDLYAQRFGLKVTGVRISSARTRWGSCSQKNALSFTWRLIMAPLEVIDYVVIHELAHILEKNHSRAYWANVEQMLPDYKVRRAWLRNNGRLLDLAIDADEAHLKTTK